MGAIWLNLEITRMRAKGDIDPASVFLVTGQTESAMNHTVRLELKLR
jgi:hypothetical protein